MKRKVFFRPEQAWFGDAIPFYEGGTFYIYYLCDERKTSETAYRKPWNLVTTRDFINWKDEGE